MPRAYGWRCFALLGSILTATVGVQAAPALAGATIHNGVVLLGINDEGDLNFNDGVRPVGVNFLTTGFDGTRAGYSPEGWGAAATDGAGVFSGSSGRTTGVDVTLESFTSTASTATSITNIGAKLRVTQKFAPASETPNLYAIEVTLENLTAGPLSDVRYSRAMDWDVEPTPFEELVTIQRGATPAPAGNLLYAGDNGFNSPNPYGVRFEVVAGTTNADFVDSGPADHGALFDFGFGDLPAGGKKTFKVYYGAAESEAVADSVVSAAGAEMYSYGQTTRGGATGAPNTFILAFRAVGGAPIIPPTLTLSPATGTGAVGTSHTLTASLKDSAANPVPGAPIVFERTGANPGGGTGTTSAGGDATHTYTGASAGDDAIKACYDTSGDGVCQSDEVTATAAFTWTGVVPTKHDTSTTYSGVASVQYSDAAALSGTLLDTTLDPDAAIAGKQLDFTLGGQSASAGPTSATGIVSTSLVVTALPGSVSTVASSFAGDADYTASNDSDPFSVTKEDCTLTYAGDTLVAPATNTTLAADLGEPDSSLGDLANKTVTFTVTDAGMNVQTFTATTNAAGRASTSQALGSNVYGVSVSFAGDDYYKSCSTATDALVTVQAAGSKVTGGGWISISTGRTNFGFNAKPEAGGLFKGQFQLRSNNGKNRFHGNTVTTLTGTANTATWSGTGRWNGTPGYRYTISVVDNGSSGAKKSDTITITIKSPTNVTVYTTSGSQTLKGGNITVH